MAVYRIVVFVSLVFRIVPLFRIVYFAPLRASAQCILAVLPKSSGVFNGETGRDSVLSNPHAITRDGESLTFAQDSSPSSPYRQQSAQREQQMIVMKRSNDDDQRCARRKCSSGMQMSSYQPKLVSKAKVVNNNQSYGVDKVRTQLKASIAAPVNLWSTPYYTSHNLSIHLHEHART